MKDSRGFAAIEGLLILILVGIIGGTGWYVWKAHDKANKSLDNATQSSNTTANIPKKTKTTNAQNTNSRDIVIQGVEKALNAKDTSLLVGYMADKVEIVKQSTDSPTGPYDKTTAANSVVNYYSVAGHAQLPWKFEGNDAIIAKIKAGQYPERVQDATVGISQDNWFISFKLNSDNKVSTVSMSVNYTLMTGGQP